MAARAPGTRPTVESVARHARVSRQTVSNALNAPQRVRPDTLSRVLASIEQLGYRPNSAARNLRTQSTRLLGCRLLPSLQMGTGGVLDRFLHALCDAARDRKLTVLLHGQAGNLGLSYDGMQLLPELVRRGRWLRLFREGQALGIRYCTVEEVTKNLK